MFKCEICGKEFTNHNKLNGHKKCHRKKVKVKLYPCQLRISGECEKMTTNRFNCPACLSALKSNSKYSGFLAQVECIGIETTGMKGW